jgi:hypothetical protein
MGAWCHGLRAMGDGTPWVSIRSCPTLAEIQSLYVDLYSEYNQTTTKGQGNELTARTKITRARAVTGIDPLIHLPGTRVAMNF